MDFANKRRLPEKQIMAARKNISMNFCQTTLLMQTSNYMIFFSKLNFYHDHFTPNVWWQLHNVWWMLQIDGNSAQNLPLDFHHLLF